MNNVRIYDPERKPQHWNSMLSARQVAVMHYDVKTGTWRTADGEYSNSREEETILIFDALDEARDYCRAHVEVRPGLFCRIYDRRGTAEGEVEAIYARAVAQKTQGPRAARKKIGNGVLLVLASVGCVLVDWRLGGPVIFGVLVGSKFLTSGIMRVVEGCSSLMDSREK